MTAAVPWCWISYLLSAVADEAAMCSRSQQSLGCVCTHPHPGSVQLLNIPLLLSLLWFLPLVSISSLWFLSAAVDSCSLALTQQWPASLRCVCPYLVPQTKKYFILSGPKDQIWTGDSFPHWILDLPLFSAEQCTLPSSTDRSLGEGDGSRSHLASSVGLWHVGRELWRRLLLGKLLPIFFRKRQKATA